jgi:hypothetical protein
VKATKGNNLCSSVDDEATATVTTTETNVHVETTSSAVQNSTSFANTLSVDDVIRLVEERILNQMDGRDLTRIVATEALCQVDVYCVSQEKGAIYRQDRHLDANFNRPSFVKKLQQAFSDDIQFDQIILDYFWIPTGWDVHHWSTNFFESVLISFAQSKLLSPLLPSMSGHAGPFRNGIFLPFCFHCFQSVVTYTAILTSYYNISFLRKNQLQCIALWAGTQTVDKQRMQHILGKRIDQEEVYCTFSARHMKEMECSATGASKQELIHIANSLEDFPDIRFILLEPLHILDPSHPHYVPGSILGLTSPHRIQRGFRSDEKLMPFVEQRLVPATVAQYLTTSSSSSSAVAARKRTASNVPTSSGCVHSPRKSPRFEFRRQSPDSVLIESLQSSLSTKNKRALRPKVLFPALDEDASR